MSKFESIFSSNTNIDSNLSSLFKKKIAEPELPAKNIELPGAVDSEDDELQNEELDQLKTEIKQVGKKAKKLKSEKKVKRIDLETESRTIFVGNLHKDCKKSVNKSQICINFEGNYEYLNIFRSLKGAYEVV
jgi:hypothetical protein